MLGETQLLIISAFLIINASGSALHGECVRDEQCGTFDTFCKMGSCVCNENFAVVYDTCVQLTTPRISCIRKTECQTILGARSLCKEGQCACRSFHHLYNNQCIKSRGLDEMCEFDNQCYCGQNCNDKIECVNRVCTCKKGFKRHNRRCIYDPKFSFETGFGKETVDSSAILSKCSLVVVLTSLFFSMIL